MRERSEKLLSGQIRQLRGAGPKRFRDDAKVVTYSVTETVWTPPAVALESAAEVPA